MDETTLSIRAHGADGLNTVSNAAFLDAIQQARGAIRQNPQNPHGVTYGTRVIEIPAGDYRITDLRGLMGQERQGPMISGLRFRGAGKDLTHIIFDPEPGEDGALAFNDWWMNVAFEGMSFRATREGLTFMQSYTTHAAQKYTFTDVAWLGPWKYCFDLQGNNNNSEYAFYSCETSGMADDGAFLYIGAVNTSDQFLNYWFYGFKHWSTSATLIDAARGGHFHLYGVDVSAWGRGLTETNHVFKLRGYSHARGVLSFTVHGLRVEAMSPHAALIHSEWPGGNVTVQCDWSSQSHVYTYGDIIHLDIQNGGGAIYHFHDSTFAGGVNIAYKNNSRKHQQRIIFDRCNWFQKLTPSDVVTYTYGDPWGDPPRPVVKFRDCRSMGAQNTDAAAEWDNYA